jgi:hypothetical protein
VDEEQKFVNKPYLLVNSVGQIANSKVPTNFVPAVAVIRREQVLFVVTGCKRFVDGICVISFYLNGGKSRFET